MRAEHFTLIVFLGCAGRALAVPTPLWFWVVLALALALNAGVLAGDRAK